MSDEGRVPITVVGGSEIAKPSDKPVFGEQRLVRYLPVPIPGTNGMMFPCIWMSPYEVYDDDEKGNVRVCLILAGKGPPRPEIICVRIATAAIEKFPKGPVEW